MSKRNKRIILICCVLAMLLTGGAVVRFAFAADTVPMPGNEGIPRMRYDIYQMYVDGEYSESEFTWFGKSYNINTEMNASSNSYHGIKITKNSGNKGLSNITMQLASAGVVSDMDVWLYGSAAYNEEMVNNFVLLQRFYVSTSSYGNGWYDFDMGTWYGGNNILNLNDSKSGYVDTLLPAVSYEYGKYNWRIYCNGKGTAEKFSYYLLDKGIAGTDGWTVELEESGDNAADGSTVYQLVVRDKNGDQFRPANKQITYDDLATLQLEVTMQSTDTLSEGKTYTIPAKAVEIRGKVTSDQGYPSAIVFEFYGDEWLNMEDQVVITGVKAVQVVPEGEEAPAYEIWDMYSDNTDYVVPTSLTDEFGFTSSTPVTDFAGNEIKWEDTTIDLKGEMTMDRQEASIVAVDMDFRCFLGSSSTSTEADYADSFAGPWNYIFWPTLITNEEMYISDEAIGNVAIQWNLTDENGEPIISKLERSYTYTDDNGIVYTKLVFESLAISQPIGKLFGYTDQTVSAVGPQGEQIVVEKIINEHLLQDRVGNTNISNDILMTGDVNTSIWPEKIAYLDTVAPEVTLLDTVVRNKTSDTDGKVESIQITVPFKITDYDPGSGLMRSTASGTTAKLRLSNPVDGQEIEYKYAITYTTDFPDTTNEKIWNTGNLGSPEQSAYATFGVGDDTKNIYLHIELSKLSNYEISETEGLNLELMIQDMAKNHTTVYENISGIYGVDNVGPEVTLSNRTISVGADGESVDFGANVKITDTNGINQVEYRFVDSEEDTETAYNVLYRKADDESYQTALYKSASQNFVVSADQEDKLVEKIMQIRVYDKNNNPTIASMAFSADLSKVITNYDLTENIFQPSLQTGIQISTPIYNGTLSDTACTRVTVVVPNNDASDEDGRDIYFRVIPVSEMTDPVQALDPDAAWYKVGECTYLDHMGYYVYQQIEAVTGQPGWTEHYGEMDVYVASSNLNMLNMTQYDDGGNLILDPGYSNDLEDHDATYSWSKLGTVSYAGDVDDAYSMTYDTSGYRVLLTDSTGTEVAATIKWDENDSNVELYRYAKFDQTLAGVRVSVTLANTLAEEWGTEGIDFENSYAVLVRADEEGNLIKNDDGSYDEVTARVLLSNSLNQTLTVPDTTADGTPFTSGVYTWVVHIAQRGGESDFAEGEVYMILDNADVPENFGILEHTTKIQVVDGYGGDYHQYVTSTQTPEEGQDTLSVINIGIAKPSAMMIEESDEEAGTTAYVYSEELETVQIDGFTAYLKGIANSSEFANSYQSRQQGSFTITADMTGSGYGTYLGQEIGTVQGIRFWNTANVDDYTEVDYIEYGQSYQDSRRGITAVFSQENGVAKLDVSFNVAWYMPGENPLYESAEALKEALPNGQFALIMGENTICYQLLMDNGKESSIYQFKLNLVEEAPRVNVDFDYGPYYTYSYSDDGDDAVRYVEYAYVSFRDMFSLYSGLKVYHVQYVESGTGMFQYYEIKQLTDDEITNGYRIDYGCSGYDGAYDYDSFGYQGTTLTGQYKCQGTETFFVILDNSGNAVTVYPMDSSIQAAELYGEPDKFVKNQVYGKFSPEKLTYLDQQEEGMQIAQLTYEDESIDYGVSLDYADQIEFRIDADRASTEEEKEALWVSVDMDNGTVPAPNASGLGSVSIGYAGSIGFVVPYDPDVAEGEIISHTAEVRYYGEADASGEANFVYEGSVTFDAVNTKPAITSVETKAGCIMVTYNVAVTTEDGPSNVQYIPVRDDSVYGSEYSHTFQDLFGNEYTETFTVPAAAADPVITYSTTEIAGEVTVTIETADANGVMVQSDVDWDALVWDDETGMYFDPVKQAYYDMGTNLYCAFNVDENGAFTDLDEYGDPIPAGYYLDPACQIEVTGNKTQMITITAHANFSTDVYYYGDDSYAGYVEVRNAAKTAEVDPYISWNYNIGNVNEGNVVYGSVTAYLVDRNGQPLLDPATGDIAKFVFTPDGPTEYTFTGCYSEVTNTPVPDTTAVLEVTLQPEPTQEKDTYAPDVDVVAYLSSDTGARAANMVYRQDSGRFALYDYAFDYELEEDEVYYDDINEMIANMGWSKSYMFHLDVHDDSRVKLILSNEIKESGITYTTASETVEGVSLVGRMLQVTENCEFALYIVDEENNITPLHFKVTNLTDAPAPELAQADSLTADGKPAVRVYLLPPQVADYQELKITNAGKQTDLEEYEGVTSDYYGLDYMLYSTSGTYTIYYSYKVEGYTDAFEGELKATVSVPELTEPSVKTFFWSANYFNKSTNQEIALNLKLNVPVYDISVVYTVDGGSEYLVSKTVLESCGIHVGYFQDDCTVTFEQNTDALQTLLSEQWGEGTIRLKMTELTSMQSIVGSIGYYELPEVKTIDHDAPVLEDVKIEVDRDNYKSAQVILKLNETALSRDGTQKGTEFSYTVRENKTYTYTFLDEAGNTSTFDVEVTDLITEPLKITLSTSASDASIITDPATYQAQVGQTLYAKINRDATVYIYGKGSEETTTTTAKDSWVAVTVTENSMGMHPSVVARDNYGNIAIVQLEYIPIKDVTAPAASLHRDMVSVSATATEEEIEKVLLDNIFYSDDTTSIDDLTVTIDYDKIVSGKTAATYTITDEEGNSTVRRCWLRIRSGLEPVIHVNGILVEDGAFLYVSDTNDLEITVEFDGDVAEPYKLVYEEEDLRSWAMMKEGTWLTSGYDDPKSQTYQVEDLGDGWYSFALTTQGMEIYFFEVHIGQVQ